MTVTDNKEQHRYELEVEGQTVFADYRREGHTLFITHVESPVALRGKGAASQLMQGVIELTGKETDVKIVPICSYAAAWMARHTL